LFLLQNEADYLLELEKKFVDNHPIVLGDTPIKCNHKLISMDGRETFFLDVWRARISLQKYTLQERGRTVVVLLRLDIGGPMHTNPDGETVQCPHLHIYREGYADKWARPLDDYPFSTPNDIVTTFMEFTRLCNIAELPDIQRSLI